MTSDEISRTIEFILQSQANAVVRMDETEKHLRKLDELADTTSRQIREVTESTSRHIRELADLTSRQILELADSTNRLIQEFTDSNGHQILELTTSTIRFQDDVKGFIRVVAPILEIQSKRLDRLEGLP